MAGTITIALDCMGGDNAPGIVIDGAAQALARHPDLRFLLFGDEQKIKPHLSKASGLSGVAEVRHTGDEVKPTDAPAQALRQGRQSSMRLAINAVKDGEAGAVVSAGNTGALMAMSKFVFKTLDGIDRPAICSMMPTMQGETTVLDLGANIECNSDNLVQFAIMGAALARIELNRDRPSVGLLNVGEEELKGGDALKDAAQILRTVDLPIDFHGFIEGDDIAKGTTDVVVTDGFSGNVVLKAIEGTSKLFGEFLRSALTSTLFARLGYLLARRALGALRRKIDPRRYNGGVFLGLNGVCVKSHGGTDGFGFSHAIELAHDAVRDDLIGRIGADVSRLVNISAQNQKTAVS